MLNMATGYAMGLSIPASVRTAFTTTCSFTDRRAAFRCDVLTSNVFFRVYFVFL